MLFEYISPKRGGFVGEEDRHWYAACWPSCWLTAHPAQCPPTVLQSQSLCMDVVLVWATDTDLEEETTKKAEEKWSNKEEMKDGELICFMFILHI